jgi:hypothetical protein
MTEEKKYQADKSEKAEEKPALTEAVGEEVLPPSSLDAVQVEAFAYHTKDPFKEGILDKKEVRKNEEKREEEYAKWEEKQAKVAEERQKKVESRS